MTKLELTTTHQRRFELSSNISNLHSSFEKNINKKDEAIPFLSIKENLPAREQAVNDSFDKHYDLCYKTGILNTGLQMASGIALMGLALFGKRSTTRKGPFRLMGKEKVPDLYEGISKKIAGAASIALGMGYFIGGPSVTGAGIKSEQPGTLLSGLIWFAASPFMMLGQSTRLNGILAAAYAPTFAGFSNEINTRYRKEENNEDRKMNMEFLLKKETYVNCFSSNENGKKIRDKFSDIIKFCAVDQMNSVKTTGKTFKNAAEQSVQFFKGDRKEAPDIFSTKPSKESMCLGSLLLLLGSVPKIIRGANLSTKKMKVADCLTGAGFFFESIGMISLANKKDDSRRPAVLAGGPMRVIGDFGQENPFLYGLRTLGGASFEYYYTLMNKEKDGVIASDSEPSFIKKLPDFVKKPSSISLKHLFKSED